ncbi:DUF3179 domain-containing protein, partial [Candidatus Woesearchaeota archaeon]|nr:DUF3179 domain-containing protein [Candidatus Woesearchaeota archaeon]
FPAKKVVHGIELNNEYLTIPKEEFKNIKQKEYVLGNEKIMIIYDNKLDMIKVYKNEVKDENLLPSFDLYWFAWYAYHPDTKILEV